MTQTSSEGQHTIRVFADVLEFAAAAGSTLGTSDWAPISQERIDTFADATDDHQWIHVDAGRAATGPYGATVAHGYLTLSLIPSMLRTIYVVEGLKHAVNYGLNKVRFPAPVPVDSEVRVVAELLSSQMLEGSVQGEVSSTVEVRGQDKPACVAVSVVRYFA